MENNKLNSSLNRLTEILGYLRDQVSKLINFCTNEQRERSNTNKTFIYKIEDDNLRITNNEGDDWGLDDPTNPNNHFNNTKLVITDHDDPNAIFTVKTASNEKNNNTCTIL